MVTADNLNTLEIKINEDLKKISAWFKANGLTIHPGKTRAILFGRGNLSLYIDNQQIANCGNNYDEKNVNMLGVILDQKLNWSQMIEKVENSITKARFILRKFKSSLTVNGRKLLYYAFVESHLRYGISLWGMSKGRALTRLKLKHKSIIRTLEVGKFHTEPILKRNKLLKIEDIYKLKMSTIAWQFNKHRLPKAVTELIEYRNIARELREVSKVIVPRTRNECDKCQLTSLFANISII